MISLWLGMPGCGKTTHMRDLVSKAAYEKWGCAVIDRASEWTEENAGWRGNPPPIDIASTDIAEATKQLVEAREHGRVVLFQAPWESIDVAELVASVGDLIFADDEIDLVATNNSVGGRSWFQNPLRNFIHRGRHLPDAEGVPREVHIFGAARRPQNLHTDLTSMASQVFVYRCNGVNTLKRIRDENYVNEDQLREVPLLPNFECFMWKEDGSITRGSIINPYKTK